MDYGSCLKIVKSTERRVSNTFDKIIKIQPITFPAHYQKEQLLTICHCYRREDESITRIISARKAIRHEEELYGGIFLVNEYTHIDLSDIPEITSKMKARDFG